MENKPIVTCHGDQNLFASLHQAVVQRLPGEPIEWHRSYGRPARVVRVEANFVPFNPDIIPGPAEWTLLGRPFFHTYWTDCDLDTYRSSVKEDIAEWLACLRTAGCPDWMVVVVVNEENKMKTKLLRQSVLDKVKSDFCSKQNERCIVLSEPFRNDSRSSESWQLLLGRMRQLLLQSFNNNLLRFEEHMRAERERRTEKGWSFSKYFLLQEELAFLFEMLGQYEDALVQYDELDALMTQFVLNHVAGASAEWVNMFTENPCNSWDGLCLSQPINIEKRQLIKKGRASLLDFRNYLFSRQCTLLFLMYRPAEVAQRAIPFMHNCIQELDSLEITMPEGSVSCWVFLSSLEVLNSAEKFHKSGQMEAHGLHTANLWDYARIKMHELGVQCGLMPDGQPSSRQLNMVVDLIAGLSAAQDESEPLAKLREALSSKDAFRRHYLELSELAMGTFKHIGRIRSARMIGRDLADFYMKLDEPAKAEGFLLDALKTYRSEGWRLLADHTRVLIARCQKELNNTHRYVKACCHVAASPVLKEDARLHFLGEVLRIAPEHIDKPLELWVRPLFNVSAPHSRRRESILDKECHLTLILTCHAPQPLTIDELHLVMSGPASVSKASTPEHKSRTISMSSAVSTGEEPTGVTMSNNPPLLDMEDITEVRPDKTVSMAATVCHTELQRTDSGQQLTQETDVVPDTGESRLHLEGPLDLQPGDNTVTLKGRLPATGTFLASQLCIKMQGLQFFKNMASGKLKMEVISEQPSVVMDLPQVQLLAGLCQQLKLVFHSGTQSYSEVTTLDLKPSLALQVLTPSAELVLPSAYPHDSHEMSLLVQGQVPPKEKARAAYMLEIGGGWLNRPQPIELEFHRPLTFSHKLHTSTSRKFIQLYVQSPYKSLSLCDPVLTTENPDVELLPMNKTGQQTSLEPEQNMSYLWELKANIPETPPLDCKFCVTYWDSPDEMASPPQCTYSFTVDNYQTLFSVRSDICSGGEEAPCQMGTVCQLRVTVSALQPSEPHPTNLAYEVTADTDIWMLTGRTTGVFELTSAEYVAELDAVPLCGGYLPLPVVALGLQVPSAEKTENPLSSGDSATRTEPLLRGQVYNCSAAQQVHVLPVPNTTHVDVS